MSQSESLVVDMVAETLQVQQVEEKIENQYLIKLESTESVREVLTQEEIEAFARLSIKEIKEDRSGIGLAPQGLTSQEDLGTAHSYDHTSGQKIATYTLFNPVFQNRSGEFEWTVFVGLEEEIQMLLAEFNALKNRPKPIVNQSPKIGRNDICPCGSTKKYKKCCLNT